MIKHYSERADREKCGKQIHVKAKVRVAEQGWWRSHLTLGSRAHPRSPGKRAANTQTSSLGVWLQLCCVWSAIPLGNPTKIFGWVFGTTGEETSSSPPPVWRALYTFMLCWLHTSAVQTPAVRLLACTHGSQGLQKGCQQKTVRWAAVQGSCSWHKLLWILLFHSEAASCSSSLMSRWNLLFSLQRITNLFSYINTLLLLSE